MAQSHPNLVRRRLGRRLAALRAEAGKTPQDVHDARINISRTKLWRFERGQSTTVSYGDVLALCRFYGVKDRYRENELARMAQATLDRGWWEPYGDGVPKWFQLFVELESDCSRMQIYEDGFVNGLFQTEDYMRAVYERDPLAGPDVTDKAVALRLARQRDFWSRETLPQLQLVCAESAMMRQIGGEAVHAKQLELLREKAQHPQVDIRVIPHSVGAHPSISRNYTMMEFDHADDPNVVYSENLDGCRYDDSAEMFTRCQGIFKASLALSVPVEEYLT